MKAERLLSFVALASAWLGVQACFTDNQAAYQGILGRSVREPPEEPGTTSGGTGAGGATGGGPATTAGAGGATAGKGGMGEGGEATGGGAGGSAGTAGTTGENPPVDPNFSPACFLTPTQSGEEILKGTPCTPEDPQLCYRPCGPHQVGWKTETCLAGVYAEGDCTFPADKDYSCYAIPDEIDVSACGLTAPPAATEECGAPPCTTCNFGGFYEDTGNDVKEGYCVCRDPDQDGIRRWTCASVTAWPCPFSQGC